MINSTIPNQKLWTSDRRIYTNKAGEIVEKGALDATTLLVAEGGQIPMAQAIELGLVEPEAPKAEKPAKKAEAKAEEPAPAEEADRDEVPAEIKKPASKK